MKMLYQLNDMREAMMAPMHLASELGQAFFSNPFLPTTYMQAGREIKASFVVAERTTRHFYKPSFNIKETVVNGKKVGITEETPISFPFCKLLHFKKDTTIKQPTMIVVAPMSGHYATLLRGTVEGLLTDHDVYITDWTNCRNVPLLAGTFTLDDYVEYLLHFMRSMEGPYHMLAVCQPSVPVLIATSLMAEFNDTNPPRSITLMGGPIDTRVNPTKVNDVTANKSIEWFDEHIITQIPPYYAGAMRRVCPGFILLSGFMSMNMKRHTKAQTDLFQDLIKGDTSHADHIKTFYDEYLSVMDIPAEYYLDTMKAAFKEHLLPKGQMTWRDMPIRPACITKTALLTVEGELDDISGVGQTYAAHSLCTNLPSNKKKHLLQKDTGHYGIFNGSKWRDKIVPVVTAFVKENNIA